MIKEITTNIYKTSDGEEFFDKAKAEEHQQYLEKPKVYVVSTIRSNSILLVTKDHTKAIDCKSNYSGIGVSINTYILE